MFFCLKRHILTFPARKFAKKCKKICKNEKKVVTLRDFLNYALLYTQNYIQDMTRTTFNRLRDVKDSLPHGSMAVIAEELGITADEVRAFFNGQGTPESGYHIEPGPDGGIVMLHNARILEVALRILWEVRNGI